MSIGTKLKALIDYRETNVNKLAKQTHVSPQTIYGIIKRDNTKVDINILQALSDELNVTLDYFATGKTDETSIEEEEMISLYKKLDTHGRRAIRALMEVEIARINEENTQIV